MKTSQMSTWTEKHPWIRNWSWELSSAVFSMICMAAIVVVLVLTQNQSLNKWNLPISPNALISILSTLSKSAMLVVLTTGISQLKWIYFQQREHRLNDLELFDEASRGPWGSLEFLLRIRWHAVVASCGALLTLISLAMDPFAQQILSYANQQKLTPAAGAALSVTHTFDNGVLFLDKDSTLLPAADSRVWTKTSAVSEAFYQGLFTDDSRPSFTCNSGNCTWQDYQSLEICASCNRITGESLGLPNPVECGAPTIHLGRNNVSDASITCWTTPAGFQFLLIDELSGTRKDPIADEVTHLLSTPKPHPSGFPWLVELGTLQEGEHWRERFNMGQTEFSNQGGTTPVIHECEFRWCARSYTKATFAGNDFQELEQSVAELEFPESGCSTTASGIEYPENRPLNVQTCTGHAVGHDDRSDGGTTTMEASSEHNTYVINRYNSEQVVTSLLDLLNVTLVEGNYNPVSHALLGKNDGNITKTMESIAKSMSNAVRQGDNSTTVQGNAQVIEPYIHVHWLWLILPLATVVLSTCFLAISMVFSAEHSNVVWKTSSLALLFHGLEHHDPELLRLKGLHDMEHRAKSVRAQLIEAVSGDVRLV